MALSAHSSGALVHFIDPTQLVQLHVFTYDEVSFSEGIYKKVDDIPQTSLAPATSMTWINVDGVHQHDIIAQLCNRYDIHFLMQEDIKIIEQRTKLDTLANAFFLVCKLIFRDISRSVTNIEQISFYLKKDILITFQETPKDLFESIKNRIRQGKGRIRRSKIDYLLYLLIDVIVDHYIDVLDTMRIKVDTIDNQLMKTRKRDTLELIYDMKRDMRYLRTVISPLKEILIKLRKEEETEIMQESTNIYLKDLFDQVVQVNDSIAQMENNLNSHRSTSRCSIF